MSVPEGDISDANLGIPLPMPLLAGVILPTPELEHDDLIVEPVTNDLASYGRPFDERRSSTHIRTIGPDEHFVESNGRASLALEAGKSDLLPRLDAKLLASRPNYRVCHSL
jgi:hypothetical protein